MQGIPIFLIFAPEHRLWVLVITASAEKFSIFKAKKSLFIAWASFRNEVLDLWICLHSKNSYSDNQCNAINEVCVFNFLSIEQFMTYHSTVQSISSSDLGLKSRVIAL